MHRIDIEPLGLGEMGRRYLVRHAGEVLVERSRNPEFDACRALLARGITGRLEAWHQGASYPSMRLDIEKAAKLTVKDGDGGTGFAGWTPRPEGLGQYAVSHTTVRPRTGTDET